MELDSVSLKFVQSFEYKEALKAINTWRPNWEDKEAYPEDLTLDQWAWEFLRRNQIYQQCWLLNKRSYLLENKLKLEFDICQLCSPDTNWERIEKSIFTPHMSLPIVVGEQSDFASHILPIEQTEAVMKFDLRRDLRSQLRSAEYQLNLWRAIAERRLAGEFSQKRFKKDLFPLYLRLLDAEYSIGTTELRPLVKKVIAILALGEDNSPPDFPVTRRLEADLKQARRMRDGGYRELGHLDNEFHKDILKHIRKEDWNDKSE